MTASKQPNDANAAIGPYRIKINEEQTPSQRPQQCGSSAASCWPPQHTHSSRAAWACCGGARRAAPSQRRKQANATLLACAQAPDLFYLGDNETLYLRYLNSTRQLQNAKVEPKIIKEENKELITQLWRDRRMIVHDKAAYRKLVGRRRHGDDATSWRGAAARRRSGTTTGARTRPPL